VLKSAELESTDSGNAAGALFVDDGLPGDFIVLPAGSLYAHGAEQSDSQRSGALKTSSRQGKLGLISQLPAPMRRNGAGFFSLHGRRVRMKAR
jgi:hypothetical protein